jgi:hypothetical protein
VATAPSSDRLDRLLPPRRDRLVTFALPKVESAKDACAAAGHACLAHLVQGTVCKILDQEEVKPHKVRYYLE